MNIMIPSIYTIGGLNHQINYTLDMLLQVEIEEPDTEPIEMSRDRCWNKRPKQFVGAKPLPWRNHKERKITFEPVTDLHWSMG